LCILQRSQQRHQKTPKYDSVREEAHEEIYQMQRQLAELHKLQNGMARVLNSEMSVIQLGSLVITNKARFYISVSLGEFFFEGDRMYAISEESPMAKMMIERRLVTNLFSTESTKRLKRFTKPDIRAIKYKNALSRSLTTHFFSSAFHCIACEIYPLILRDRPVNIESG
jgi:hypothetical protein